MRQVTALHFGYAGVLTEGAIRITVEDCPGHRRRWRIRTGGRMYNFAADGLSQLVLFTGCHADGRHGFVSNGAQHGLRHRLPPLPVTTAATWRRPPPVDARACCIDNISGDRQQPRSS